MDTLSPNDTSRKGANENEAQRLQPGACEGRPHSPGRGELGADGQRIASSITLEAVSDLGIAERSEVSAVVKVSNVMIAIGD